MTGFEELVTIGRVVKPQGRKGELAVQPLSDRPERFPTLRHVFLPGPGGTAVAKAVASCWPHKGRFVLKLEGVDSIDAGRGAARPGAAHRPRRSWRRSPKAPTTTTSSRGLAVEDAAGSPLGTRGGRPGHGRGRRRAGGRGAAAASRSSRWPRTSCGAWTSTQGRIVVRPAGVRGCWPLTWSRSSRACWQAPLADGIVRRAVDAGLVRIDVHDLRDFSDDRHRSVDDTPFGGGPGMVMKAEPFFRAVERVLPQGPGARDAVVLLSPRGRRFDQPAARRFASLERLVLLCGRYEGVDERVAQALATEELSLGDFVLTGGEVAALAVTEATVRLLPGALGDEGSAEADSFADGLLDFPHYTRPATVRGRAVPEVLLSGDHARIRRWRRKQALARHARAPAGAAGRRAPGARGPEAAARDRGRGRARAGRARRAHRIHSKVERKAGRT